MMLLNAFTLLLSQHKTLRIDLRKTDEWMNSIIMKIIDNITSKKERKEGMQSLYNIHMVFGKNWKHDLKLYLILLLFLFQSHLHDLFLLSMQMTSP